MRRLPSDAFEAYVALGAERSYEALAQQLHVTKRTVSRVATKEGWQERLAKIEAEGHAQAFDQLVALTAEVNERHLIAAREVQEKCLEALRRLPVDSVAAAIKGLDAAIRLERLILEAPEKRTHITIDKSAQLFHHHDGAPRDAASDGKRFE